MTNTRCCKVYEDKQKFVILCLFGGVVPPSPMERYMQILPGCDCHVLEGGTLAGTRHHFSAVRQSDSGTCKYLAMPRTGTRRAERRIDWSIFSTVGLIKFSNQAGRSSRKAATFLEGFDPAVKNCSVRKLSVYLNGLSRPKRRRITMRRANPQRIGLTCQFCKPTISSREPFLRQSIHTSQRQISRRGATSIPGTRWATTASDAVKSQGSQADVARTNPSDGSTALANAAKQPTTPAEIANSVNASFEEFLGTVSNVPDKKLTGNALKSCFQAASKLHHQLKNTEARTRASASRLALLGAERTGSTLAVDADVITAGKKISQTAYSVIAHPNVEMTPQVLEIYVTIQSLLGRSESLPSILELYAHKPKPEVKGGVVQYTPQNPNAAVKAIEKPVADIALQTAIDAKNLDAALGITEAAFCVKAFKRQKLLKQGTPPAMTLAALPFGIMGLGTAYATYWQNTMDVTTAAGLGVAGISGYLFVTGSLGLIAKLSAKDQMKRVTWLPGTPLRHRWMREEEREALDKIACAWGFKETWRYGEETGPDWEGLREYMGYRQMILDRVEFMEGMN